MAFRPLLHLPRGSSGSFGSTITVASSGGTYTTLTDAKTAASSGQTILVYPGTYNEKNLAKNGVNWFFMPGANVIYTGSANGAIWDDSTNGANGAVTFKVGGMARFVMDAASHSDAGTNNVISCVNTSSSMELECSTLEVLHDLSSAVNLSCIYQNKGELHVTCKEVKAPQFLFWWTGGNGYLNCDLQTQFTNVGGAAIIATPGTGTYTPVYGDTYVSGACWVKTRHVDCAGAALYASGTNTARLWLDYGDVIQTVSSAQGVIQARGCKTYLRAQKVLPTAASAAAVEVNLGEDNTNAGILWADFDKLACSATGAISVIDGSSVIRVKEIEDENVLTNQGMVTCDQAETVLGEHHITVDRAKGGTAAVGINVVGACKLYFHGYIDVSANTTATGLPVNVQAAGLRLKGGTVLKSDGVNKCIVSGDAQTVRLLGEVTANVDKHANITTQVGTLKIDPNAI